MGNINYCLIALFFFNAEMLKQWKSDEGSTKDKVGQVEGVLTDYLIR